MRRGEGFLGPNKVPIWASFLRLLQKVTDSVTSPQIQAYAAELEECVAYTSSTSASTPACWSPKHGLDPTCPPEAGVEGLGMNTWEGV